MGKRSHSRGREKRFVGDHGSKWDGRDKRRDNELYKTVDKHYEKIVHGASKEVAEQWAERQGYKKWIEEEDGIWFSDPAEAKRFAAFVEEKGASTTVAVMSEPPSFAPSSKVSPSLFKVTRDGLAEVLEPFTLTCVLDGIIVATNSVALSWGTKQEAIDVLDMMEVQEFVPTGWLLQMEGHYGSARVDQLAVDEIARLHNKHQNSFYQSIGALLSGKMSFDVDPEIMEDIHTKIRLEPWGMCRADLSLPSFGGYSGQIFLHIRVPENPEILAALKVFQNDRRKRSDW